MDLESTLNWIILRIDKNQETIDEFDNDTLFIIFIASLDIYLLIVNGKKKL